MHETIMTNNIVTILLFQVEQQVQKYPDSFVTNFVVRAPHAMFTPEDLLLGTILKVGDIKSLVRMIKIQRWSLLLIRMWR